MTPLPESYIRTNCFQYTSADSRRKYMYDFDVDPDEIRSMPISGGDHGTCFTILDSELGLPKTSIAGYDNAHMSPFFVEKSLRTFEGQEGTICIGSEVIYKTNKSDTFVRFWYSNISKFTDPNRAKFTDIIAEYENVTVVKTGSNKLAEYNAKLASQ